MSIRFGPRLPAIRAIQSAITGAFVWRPQSAGGLCLCKSKYKFVIQVFLNAKSGSQSFTNAD